MAQMEQPDADEKHRGGDGDVGEVLRDSLDVVPGEVADPAPGCAPHKCADGREEQEAPERHLGDTHDDAQELSHTLDVTTEDDEPAATSIEERLYAIYAFRSEANDLPVSPQQASAAGA